MTKPSSEDRLLALIARVAQKDVSALRPHDDLLETLGLDSLTGLRILAAIEKQHAVRFPDASLSRLRTLAHLRRALKQAGGRP